MNPICIIVVGCTGRTGSAVLRLAAESEDFNVVAAISMKEDPKFGADAGEAVGVGKLGVAVTDTYDGEADVLVDFSAPAACAAWAGWCAKNKVAMISGSTGLEVEHQKALQQTAEVSPVMWAPNMSVGVNVLLQLVSEAATLLNEGWDIEISETHHRHKVDAPSGTAKALYEVICQSQNLNPDTAGVYGREGLCGPRRDKEIGVHALRMGNVVGEHSVHFATPQEVVTLEHRAFTRDTFAAGALRAAKWIVGRTPGLYKMKDVLFGV